MKSKASFVLVSCLLSMVACDQQELQEGDGQAQQTLPTATATPGILGVVADGTQVQMIGEGFPGAEGPITLPDGSLIFTNVDESLITKIDNEGSISTFLENTNGTLSLGFDSDGRLIGNQTEPPGQAKIAVIWPEGEQTVLADSFEGRPFGRPNDLVVDGKGGVYFTDPGPRGGEPPAPAGVSYNAVYYAHADGETIKVLDGVSRPNGVQLSRNEDVLYLADSHDEYLQAFDVQPDGTLSNRRDFARYDGGVIDANGLAIDSEGRIYVSGAGRVEVFNPQGQYLGTIPIPGEFSGNLAFAGPEKKTLYVVTRGVVWKVPMLAQGFRGRAK